MLKTNFESADGLGIRVADLNSMVKDGKLEKKAIFLLKTRHLVILKCNITIAKANS